MSLEFDNSVIERIIEKRLVSGGDIDGAVEFLRNVKPMLVELYGPVISSVLYYHIGKVTGITVANKLQKVSPQPRLDKLLRVLGIAEHARMIDDQSEITIEVKDRIDHEGAAYDIPGEGKGLGCYFVRGFIEGYLVKAYGKIDAKVAEVSCGKAGGKGCVFRLEGV